MNYFYTKILGIFLTVVFLSYLNLNLQIRFLAIVLRWLFALFGALFLGFSFSALGWFERPTWVLSILSFFILFLVKITKVWFSSLRLSYSDEPLFSMLREAELYYIPKGRRFKKLEASFIKNKFERVADLEFEALTKKSKLLSPKFLIYQSKDKTIELKCLCLASSSGQSFFYSTLMSLTKTDQWILTTNSNLPSGIYYPPTCTYQKVLLTSSFSALLKRHTKAIEGQSLVHFSIFDLERLNKLQKDLEKFNIQSGFLYPKPVRVASGRQLTPQACYRLWKESLLMDYFACSLR